jgi:hypothetical protein
MMPRNQRNHVLSAREINLLALLQPTSHSQVSKAISGLEEVQAAIEASDQVSFLGIEAAAASQRCPAMMLSRTPRRPRERAGACLLLPSLVMGAHRARPKGTPIS